MLKSDSQFTHILIITSALAIIILYYFCNKLGKSISILRDFSNRAKQEKPIDVNMPLAHNDIGDITHNIIRIYKNLHHTKEELSIEKEKLIKHLQISKEGLAVFSQEKKVIVANNLFVQYANLISDEPFSSIDDIFEVQEFKQIFDFVDKNSYPNHSREEIISDSIISNRMYFVSRQLIRNIDK